MFESLRHRFKSSTKSLTPVMIKMIVNGKKATYKHSTKFSEWAAESHTYISRYGIDDWYPVETDQNRKINIRNTMELFEKILWNKCTVYYNVLFEFDSFVVIVFDDF